MRFEVEDCTKMSYADESFDVAIDKSTLDAILCGVEGFTNAALLLSEVHRVLAVGGTYIVISYGNFESRLSHFKRDCFDWSIETKEIMTPNS